MKPEVQEQDDRLGIGDLAVADHPKRLVEVRLQHLDVLALVFVAPPLEDAVGRQIAGSEEGKALADAAGNSAVYYQLFLLSHGFKRDTCIIGLAKLAKSLLMSQRKVQDTILYLEKRRLIKRVASILGGPSKGNVYQVMLPATVAPDATVSSGATVAGHSTQSLLPTWHVKPRWRHLPPINQMMMK